MSVVSLFVEMAAWGTLVFFLAVTWSGVSADPRLAFPEDVRGERIVSGWEASPGQFPYQLSLRMVSPIGAVGGCGATLIHHEWALTAAHCTATRVTMVLRFGAVNMTRPALIFETAEYYNHPLYIEELQTVVQPHDIGVIKLNRFVEYTDLVQPIRLQSSFDRNKNYRNIRLQAAGWGRTWTGGTAPENMNWVFLTGVSNLDCWMAFGGSPIIVDSTICARHYNVTSQSTCQSPETIIEIYDKQSGGQHVALFDTSVDVKPGRQAAVYAHTCVAVFMTKAICPKAQIRGPEIKLIFKIHQTAENFPGDSGGSLVTIDYDGVVTQVGISSFVSSSGCHTGFPAGFIRPGHYHDWFLEVTGVDFDWMPEEPTTEAATTTTSSDEEETTEADQDSTEE